MNTRRILIILALILGALFLAVPTQASTRPALVNTDIAYGPSPFEHLTATYVPGRTHARWALLVHGGSWLSGDRTDQQITAERFARHGYQVFNVEYRRGVDVTLAQQLQDIRAAKGWVEHHARHFGISPRRGVLYGFSAGGHLVSLVAMDNDPDVKAVVSVDGIVEPQVLAHPANDYEARLYGREVYMMGCDYAGDTGMDACSQAWHNFMPQDWISPSAPAFYVVNGLQDPVQPWGAARNFTHLLHADGVRVHLSLVDGTADGIGGHTSRNVMDKGVRQQAMFKWLYWKVGK